MRIFPNARNRGWPLRRLGLGVLLGALAWAAGGATASAEGGLLTGPALRQALQQGGHVLYVRHGATNSGENDFWQRGGSWDRATLDDCAQQRNLSAAGRAELKRMGAAIGALPIGWGAVLASPYCRTRETAQLAFGRAETSWDLFYHRAAASKQREEGDAIIAGVKRLLATAPAAGKNTVLVSHGGNLGAAAGVYLGEGEAAVFRPGANGAFTLVARIRPDDWAKL